jgi:membrane protease YdiL (CAAX protease family)
MTKQLENPPRFGPTVRLLLGVARKRSAGRQRRQQELLNNRAGKNATNWGGIGFVFAVLLMIVLNVLAAFAVKNVVETGERIEAQRNGKIVVSREFFQAVLGHSSLYRFSDRKIFNAEDGGETGVPVSRYLENNEHLIESMYPTEARRISREFGGTPADVEQKLRHAFKTQDSSAFIAEDDAVSGVRAFSRSGPLPALLGSLVLFWWAIMLAFQGEGLELDLQRRRHPMWEWLFSHPVPPGAVFLAEMLSPMAANPIYWGGPLFAGIVYGFVYGPALGLLAFFLIGVPLTVAAACIGKALEIGVILRFSPRSRGAMIGLMSWLGYASMMLFFVGLFVLPSLLTATWKFFNLFTVLPWPWLRLFLGGQSGGSFSFVAGMLTCWLAAALAIAGAVWFSVWGTQQGLSGNFAAADAGPSASRKGGPRFGREPLYRKEFLWFIRDRSAIVQVILIPLTVAGLQVFNLRGLLAHAQGNWNYLCGVAIFFGTYFLWVLGPKSLASEGSALWIALTWPRGLENLLKAKAWLWSLISTGIVALVLGYACFLFPADIWKIALVGVGWYFFGRSMAEKAVTLVTVTSSSGEVEKVSSGRRWGAQLGMLTFSIGVLTQQWNIAIMGIVYSWITAAAMWQNFRAHLPYLYDPWSEKIPPPPTLMHAMISISILVEGGAVLMTFGLLVGGRDNIAVAQAIGYAISAVAVSIGVANFLSGRGVHPEDVWCWQPRRDPDSELEPWWRAHGFGDVKIIPALLAGACGGLALGLLARGYLALLTHLPATSEMLRKSQELMASQPDLRISYAIMAVLFAPFAEEYLFRGLLFKALDREWGGWRAVVGSAAFFAIFHPPLSWLPVALLGMANAILFKRTGRLAPAVLLHMVYNLVVVS